MLQCFLHERNKTGWAQRHSEFRWRSKIIKKGPEEADVLTDIAVGGVRTKHKNFSFTRIEMENIWRQTAFNHSEAFAEVVRENNFEHFTWLGSWLLLGFSWGEEDNCEILISRLPINNPHYYYFPALMTLLYSFTVITWSTSYLYKKSVH